MGLAFDVVEKYYIFEQIAVMWPKTSKRLRTDLHFHLNFNLFIPS